MIEHWVGPENFRKGIQSYLRAHANAGGSSEDLFAALTAASGRDVATPMRSFLEQAGVPRVSAKLSCVGSKVKVLLEQARDLPLGAKASDETRGQKWQIPVCVRASSKGAELAACTLLTEEKGELELPGKVCPDWLMPNEGANGYYRFSLPPDEMGALVRNRKLLKERERVSLAANLVAAYSDGSLPAAEVLRSLAFFVHDREPEASGALMSVLEDAHAETLAPPLRPALEAFARAEYLPLAKALGWVEKPDEDRAVSRQRGQVLSFLAFTAKDPSVRAAGAKLGKAYANLAGDGFDETAVSPSLAGLALSLAMQEGGAEMREKLIARLAKSDQSQVRRRILAALGSLRDPALVPSLLDLAFDPRLRKNERASLLFPLLNREETRDTARAWLEKNWDAMLAQVPIGRASGLVGMLAATSCDEKQAEAAEAFLRPRVAKLAVRGPCVARPREDRVGVCADGVDGSFLIRPKNRC